MPTIQISTTSLSVPARRAIAIRLTRWLSDRGVRPGHVVVRFAVDPENSVFTGGLPVEALARDVDGLRYASVVCCVGPDRDERFRAELATELAEAMGMTAQTPFLYIEFRPTPPGQVYLAANGKLRRADEEVRAQ